MNFWWSWLFVIAIIGRVLAADAIKQRSTPPGQLQLEFALYFSPKPAADPEVELKKLLADSSRRLQWSSEGPSQNGVATVEAKWAELATYAPPTADSLRYTGVGVTPDVAPQLAAADRVFILGFTMHTHGAFIGNRSASQLLADLAQTTDGLIWDEETRQLFSREQWKTKRIDSWQNNLPDMRDHVTMHAYANPDLLRIITLGMRKFGLPDLVFPEIPRNNSRVFANMINALMQRLVEGQKPEGEKFALKLHEIRHQDSRVSALENPGQNAKGAVLLSLRPAPLEEGDPRNALWRIDFPDAKFPGAIERAMWGADQLFGSTDSITNVSDRDAEMAAARERARAAFFAQEKRFRAGLEFKEHLLVKAPFKDRGQTEYMWVEVTGWGPKHVDGILSSDPFYVKNVRSGSRVKVALDDIYDYILHKPDGTQEGNESGKILERREKAK